VSTVQDSASGDLILKIVSRADVIVHMQIDISGFSRLDPQAICTVLTAEPLAENNYSFWHKQIVQPETSALTVAPQFEYAVPAHSLSVIRIRARGAAVQ